MHVQPEATTIEVATKPLWAPGAAEAVGRFIAARNGEVRILEFGSGGSTIFLLALGAHVTTVEHHSEWAGALQRAADTRGFGDRLTLLRRDRPYHDVPSEFAASTTFDILLVDGRERVECLSKALSLVCPTGIVLLDDSQRARYWPAFSLLAAKECVTYESKARNTTIWSMDEAARGAEGFVRKSFVSSTPDLEPKPKKTFVPVEFLDGSPVEPRYARRKSIENLAPVERDLQRLKLIERGATFVSPNLYELNDSSVRIDAGQKRLAYKGATYREKTGEYLLNEDLPCFEGAIHLDGRTLDLTSSGAGRYSFFLLDSLPKLEIVRAAGLSLEDFDTVLVNSGARWVHDILSLAFGDVRPIVAAFSKSHPSFHMARSTHIEGIRSARFTPRWVYAYLDRLFSDYKQGTADATDISFGPYVYISRQKASGRQIINHDDFMALVRLFGFEEVFAEDYSPLELARKLADVKVLISPHGAGLANMIFAPESATVIELFSSHYTPQYFHLAKDLGQSYVALPCVDAKGLNVFDRYDSSDQNKAAFNREDVLAPIGALRDLLATLC